jgi:hypothetical protein
MSRKHVEEFYCDRCREKYDRHPVPYRGDHYTMEIGWFLLNRGSGSKPSTPDDRKDNLDYDLCDTCTKEFRAWWKAGKK